jgi:CHAT domain-containing protein
VVVGNPTGDLPQAQEEAVAVARSLRDRIPVTTLLRADATSKAIGEALRGADVLHWAGHGVFGGLEGSESALPLADGARLTVADVLVLAPAPRSVVLSGCDAAKTETEAEGLGLAQVFVVAGAEEVIAPVRPVSDALAKRLAAELYAGAPGEPLSAALRRATTRLRADDPKADWASFRTLAR